MFGYPYGLSNGYDQHEPSDDDIEFGAEIEGMPLSQVQMVQDVHQNVVGSTGRIKGKTFEDPVHGELKIRGECLKFMDTQEFQRLRNLKQLGCTEFVYQTATHTRFEHSIGVAFKASQVASCLYLMAQMGCEEWVKEFSRRDMNSDVKCVEIAGLCHDLGHGPYSHMFENEFLPKMMGTEAAKQWSHEGMGVRMLESMVESNGGPENFHVTEQELQLIKDLILCDKERRSNLNGRQFLFDIVANKRNGIDVDKWDYLARDAHYCGIKGCEIDNTKLAGMLKVIDGEICYHFSRWEQIQHMFQSRATMHRKVYTHPRVKSVEFMVADAMAEANGELQIVEALNEPERYLYLDDHIIRDIEKSTGSGLKKAQEIINRIRKRDLYKFVDEAFLAPDFVMPSTSDIANCLTETGKRSLRPEDLVLHDRKIDYGMKAQNPLEHASFFKDWSDTTSYRCKGHEISSMLPENFSERKVRVFVKDSSKVEQAKNAFDNWRAKNLKSNQKDSGKRSRVSWAAPTPDQQKHRITVQQQKL